MSSERAAAWVSPNSRSALGLVGFLSAIIWESLGQTSLSNCKRFAAKPASRLVTPVMLLPGRARLTINPAPDLRCLLRFGRERRQGEAERENEPDPSHGHLGGGRLPGV